MLYVYTDYSQDISFAIFVVNEKLCKKVIENIKENFGFELDDADDDSDFTDLGEFINDTLIIKYAHCNEDFYALAEKIHLYVIP